MTSTNAYLKAVLTARVYDVAKETSLDYAPELSSRLSNKVLLKREDTQPIFSFKIRGAYNKMASLTIEERQRGVIASSAGNHAQGVALSAAMLKCAATIVMPTTTPEVKVSAVRRLGGKWVSVVLFGESYTDAFEHASELQIVKKLSFIHPFDDPAVIAGQGTVAMEILRQQTEDPFAIFVPIGGGGLAAGVAVYIKALKPHIKVIGVQTVDSDAMAQSIAASKNIYLDNVGIFSDGTAVKKVGTETLRLCKSFLDDVVLVNTDAICAAIKDIFRDTRSLVEPAGALAVAGLKTYILKNNLKDVTLTAIISGANLNFDRMRFIAERADVGEAREAVYAVKIREKRGSFLKFCRILGKRHITEFSYRISSSDEANIFVSIQTEKALEKDILLNSFTQSGFDAIDLCDNELAKRHIRYMIGGKPNLAKRERLYRFQFPERRGTLIDFLSSMPDRCNISLFHYRNEGADYSSVLVGIQIDSAEEEKFLQFCEALSYPYWDETDNPAYKVSLACIE